MRILNLCFFTFFSILVRSNLTVYSYKFPFSFNILKKIELFSGNNKKITKQSIDSIERKDYYESSDLIWNDRKMKKFKKSIMDSYDINGIPSNILLIEPNEDILVKTGSLLVHSPLVKAM